MKWKRCTCVFFFLFNSVQPLHSWSFHVFHLKSFMDNMPKYWLFNTKSTSKCMLSILHLLKSLYKHIQSLNVFFKFVNEIHEECKRWKNKRILRNLKKKIPRFVVSLLLNWLDFWYSFYNFFEPAITSFP